MNKNYLEEVDKIIESALMEKTFNLDIIQKIKEMRDNLISLQTINESNKETIELSGKNYSKLNDSFVKMTAELSELKLRESELEKKERDIFAKEIIAESQKVQKDLVLSMFNTVFKNTEVKSAIFRNVQVSQNGYSSQQPESETKIETKE